MDRAPIARPVEAPARASPVSNGADHESLAAQRERLARLREREKDIRALREREGDLEVERIAAEAALGAASPAPPLGLDDEARLAIARSMERKHGIEEAVAALEKGLARGGPATPEELEDLRNAREALRAWLDAPRAQAAAPAGRGAALALVAISAACIWAAIALHPAFLLLLVVIAGPMSFLMYRGQDAQWRRLGARRRFEATGLEPPARWEESDVRARLESLEQAMEAAPSENETGDASREQLQSERTALADELAAAEHELATTLADAGVDPRDLDEDVERWLLLAGHAERARQALEDAKLRLKSAREEADALRDGLFRYLSRRGAAPGDARADTEAIAAGLDRLARRGDGDGPR